MTEVLCEACDQLGWKSPSKIQIEAIPVALQGERVLSVLLLISSHLFGFPP